MFKKRRAQKIICFILSTANFVISNPLQAEHFVISKSAAREIMERGETSALIDRIYRNNARLRNAERAVEKEKERKAAGFTHETALFEGRDVGTTFKVRYSRERLEKAENAVATLKAEIAADKQNLEAFLKQSKNSSLGTVEEFLSQEIRKIEAGHAVSQQLPEGQDVITVVNEIISKIEIEQNSAARCRSLHTDYEVINFTAIPTQTTRIPLERYSPKPWNPPPHVSKLSALEKASLDNIKSVPLAHLQHIEPQNISYSALDRLNQRTEKIAEIQGEAWPKTGSALACRGVLTSHCLRAFIENLAEDASEKDFESLTLAFDRASLAVKVKAYLEIRDLFAKKQAPENLLHWIEKRVQNDFRIATSDLLLHSLKEAATDTQWLTALTIFNQAMINRKFLESDRVMAVSLVKDLLRQHLKAEIFTVLANHLTGEDANILMEAFTQMKSQDQHKAIQALTSIFNQWSEANSNTVKVRIDSDKQLNELASWGDDKGSLKQATYTLFNSDSKNSKTTDRLEAARLIALSERMQRAVSLLPSGTKEQREFVTALARFQLRAFGDIDGAIVSLGLLPGPSISDVDAATLDLTNVFREILKTLRESRAQLTQADNAFSRFSEEHFFPSLRELQTPEERDAARPAAYIHGELNRKLVGIKEFEEAQLPNRVAQLKELARKWTDHLQAEPERFLNPLLNALGDNND